jgi:hypothetical protein
VKSEPMSAEQRMQDAREGLGMEPDEVFDDEAVGHMLIDHAAAAVERERERAMSARECETVTELRGAMSRMCELRDGLYAKLAAIKHRPAFNAKLGLTVCARCGFVPSKDEETCCRGEHAPIRPRREEDEG